MSANAFFQNDDVGHSDPGKLCNNAEELRTFLLKNGLLGHRPGPCIINKVRILCLPIKS